MIDEKTARQIVSALPIGPLRDLSSLILIAGLRLRDWTRVRKRQVRLDRRKKEVVISVRVPKNRRRRSTRTILHLPFRYVSPYLQVFESFAAVAASAAAGEEQPFADITAGRLNRALARAANRQGLPRVTSYAFRRLYINRWIRICRRDWKAVCEKTLHQNADVVKAHYEAFVIKGDDDQ